MEFDPVKEKAWKHLTEKEKQSLSLIVVLERTRPEASMIMNVSSYKFGEILTRARKFFIMFTDYYEKYPSLIPPSLDIIESPGKDYINMVVRTRETRRSQISALGFEEFISPSRKEGFWKNVKEILQKDSDPHSKAFWELLVEFDRWNSRRILPKTYQLLSPFSRRRIRVYKKIYKTLVGLSETSYRVIELHSGTKKPPLMYLPQASESNPKPISVVKSSGKIKYFTDNRLPVFLEESRAFELAEMSRIYATVKSPSSTISHKFWASFRNMITYAINAKELMEADPVEFDEVKFQDKEFIRKAQEKTKPRTARVRLTKDGEFWK